MRHLVSVLALLIALGLVVTSVVTAQTTWGMWGWEQLMVGVGAPPSTCLTGMLYVRTGSGNVSLSLCTAPNTWSAFSTGNQSSTLPSGLIFLIDSGACPAGSAEVTAMNGVTPLGTLNANGNVGGTGGADTITPAGTNDAQTIAWPAGVPTHSGITATFSGNALATHAHELPWQIPSTTTIRQIAVATFGTGTSRAATAVSAAGVGNTTSAAVALSQAVSGGTPAGAVNITSQGAVAWPAGVPTIGPPSFAGTQFDNRSAFRRVIFCKAA